jgi:hypothetical protein
MRRHTRRLFRVPALLRLGRLAMTEGAFHIFVAFVAQRAELFR